MTKSLLFLNVGNVLNSDQKAFESHMRVHTREQPFACLKYNTDCNKIHLVQRLTPKHLKNTSMLEKILAVAKNIGNALVTTSILKDT